MVTRLVNTSLARECGRGVVIGRVRLFVSVSVCLSAEMKTGSYVVENVFLATSRHSLTSMKSRQL